MTLPRRQRQRRAGGRTRESPQERLRRTKAILAGLKRAYPQAECALGHASALQLLVSTILSAQCTDDRVNLVTPALFARYRTASDFASADPAELEQMIHSTGFFRNKTRNIIGAARVIVERFGGEVPGTMDELVQLPGVARKTANVLLGTWFGRNEGIVVDTHIGRLAHRLGLTWRSKNDKDAVKIEQDLMEVMPREDWAFAGHALIWHGRQVCSARRPACARCTLAPHCPSAFTFGEARPAARGAGAGGVKPAAAGRRGARRRA
jgi:endonuclease-3